MYKGTLLKITNINMYNTSYPSTLIKDIDYKTKIRFYQTTSCVPYIWVNESYILYKIEK